MLAHCSDRRGCMGSDVIYRRLGRTGIEVSALCLGTMMLGSWGKNDAATGVEIIHRALDSGINFLDCADMYAQGECEEIIGNALSNGLRDKVVLGTKFHYPMGDDVNDRGNSRRWILKAVDGSLRRLKTDWIDLYQVHQWEPETEHEETLGALTDLVREGKIRAFGTSRYPVSQIVEAQWVARDRGLGRYVTEQPPYSMLIRGIEKEILPTCVRHGMGVITWSPLVGGWLSGKWRKDVTRPESVYEQLVPSRFDLSLADNRAKYDAADALGRLADDIGVPLVHMAIAFVLRHPAVTSAIIGPRTIEHLDSQLPAIDVTLDTSVLDAIDAIVPPGVDISPSDARGG